MELPLPPLVGVFCAAERGRVYTIIGSDNGLSPNGRQPIIWTNDGLLSIRPWGTYFNEILFQIHTFSFKNMHMKMLSAKKVAILSRPQCVKYYWLTLLWSNNTKQFITLCLLSVFHHLPYKLLWPLLPHSTLNGCNYLSMLGLKLINVSKRDPRDLPSSSIAKKKN